MRPSRFLQCFIVCCFLGISVADFGNFLSDAVKAAAEEIGGGDETRGIEDTINSIFDIGADALDDVFDDVGDAVDDLTQPDNDSGQTKSDDSVPFSQEDDLSSLLIQLDELIDAIEEAGESLTSDDVLKAVTSVLGSSIDNGSDEVAEKDLFETLMAALIKFALDDLGVETKNENVDKFVSFVSDIYGVIRTYSQDNMTSSPEDVINDVLDVVIETLTESSRLEEIKCSLTQTALTRAVGQNIALNNRQARITDIVLFLIGCTEQVGETATVKPSPNTMTNNNAEGDKQSSTIMPATATTLENNRTGEGVRRVLSILNQRFMDRLNKGLEALKERTQTMRRELVSFFDGISNDRLGSEDDEATTEKPKSDITNARNRLFGNFLKNIRQPKDGEQKLNQTQNGTESNRRPLLQLVRDRGTMFSERLNSVSDSLSSVLPGNGISEFVQETLASVANSSRVRNLNEIARSRTKALMSLIEAIFGSTYFEEIMSENPDDSDQMPDDNMAVNDNVTVDPMTAELVQTVRQVVETQFELYSLFPHSEQSMEEEEMRSPTGERVVRSPNFRDLRADLRQMEEQESNRIRAMSRQSSPSAPPEAGPKPGAISRMFLAFSLYTNIPDNLKAKHTAGDITCLHGIRVISISWVILGHCYYFAPQFSNTLALVEMSKWWSFHAILNATFAVDTFFLLSGCLVSYIFLRSISKAGGLKAYHMVLYYVHRYLRLTPLYALAILLFTGITPYLEYGPFQTKSSDRDGYCREIWWWNLLYISNLRTDMNMCMGWSWYLPNDMQFYFLAPLVLVPLALGYKYIGLLVAFLKVACHLIMYAVMEEKYDANSYRNATDFFIYIYIKPYTRCGPYAIGLALGYLLFKTKCKAKINKALVGLGWLLSTGAALTLVYITHDNLKDYGVLAPTWSNDAMNAFDIVKRPLWALCVGWVIFACATDNGGVINSFLSWQAWIPLSRLTFGTYLSHIMVLYYFNNNRRTVAYFTYQQVIERFLATFVLSYFISWVLSLLIETPVRNLIKPKKKPTAKQGSGGRNPDPQGRHSNRLSTTPSSLQQRGKVTAESLRTRNMYLPSPGVPVDVQGRMDSHFAVPNNDGMSGPGPVGHLAYGENGRMDNGGNQVRGNLYPDLAYDNPNTSQTGNDFTIPENNQGRKKVSFNVDSGDTYMAPGNSTTEPDRPMTETSASPENLSAEPQNDLLEQGVNNQERGNPETPASPDDQSNSTDNDSSVQGVTNQGFVQDPVVPSAPPRTPESERAGPSDSTSDFIRI